MGRHRLKRALAAAIGGALLTPASLLGASEGPVAQIAVTPERPVATEPVTLDAGGSSGAGLTFRWDLDGDGTFETDGGPQPIATATLAPGDHVLGVEVADGQGRTAAASARVSVAAAAEEEEKPARPRQAPAAPAAEPVVRAAATSGVVIENFLYAPRAIEVNVGDTVTWTNRDEEPHTATGDGGSFNTGTLARGESGSHTFRAAGRFPYICALHPSMRGTVVVAGAPAGGGGAEAGPAPATPSPGASSDPAAATLPATGAAVLAVALLGAALTAGGAVLRRRLSDGTLT